MGYHILFYTGLTMAIVT